MPVHFPHAIPQGKLQATLPPYTQKAIHYGIPGQRKPYRSTEGCIKISEILISGI
jgi:hypothetical protein